MTDNSRTVKATCLCGQAQHSITIPANDFPLKAYFCHCDSCRHLTGTLTHTVAFLGPHYQPPEHLLAKLQSSVAFSKRITQYFCPQCGTQMMCRVTEHGYVSWAVATGSLEEAEGVFEVQGYAHVADTIDGGFSDFLQTIHGKRVERWSGHFKRSDDLPPYWKSPERPTISPTPDDRLHAHCLCGGINFWIRRPTSSSAMGKAPWPDVLVPWHSTADEAELAPNQSWWLQSNGTKFLAGVCCCDSCRKACGMEWVEWAFVPTTDISLDAEGTEAFSRDFGMLKHYRSSARATRHFCGACGATVFWDGDERPQLIDVAVGLLEAAEGARAESWLQWQTARLSYREDALPRAEGLTLAVEEGMRAYGEHLLGEAPE